MRPILLAVSGIPTTGEGTQRRVDVLAAMRWIRKFPPDHAVIERAGVMPGQGIASGFRYGRAVGALEAVAQGLLIPLTQVEPAAWKAFHGLLKAEKEDSRQKAIAVFHGAADKFNLRTEHGKAEAALIAYYGLMKMRNVAPIRTAQA